MNKSFYFESKTEIYFGEDYLKDVGKILKKKGASKILVVIGMNSVIKSGLLDKVIKSLEAEGIQAEILKGVRANPTFDKVQEGLDLVNASTLDYLLAVGGGSVIDTAKCIAVNYYHPGDIKDFNYHRTQPTKALPIGVVLTISAAGSELSNSCVIQDDLDGTKSGFNSDLIRPQFVIEDPSLTYSVSKEQTAYGVVDIMMHSLERYFSLSGENELADDFALAVIKNTKNAGFAAFSNQNDYESRAKLMLDSSLSHNGITSIGKSYSMPVHQLEHALSGMFPNIAHGLGLAILFPAWAKYFAKFDIEKFARLARVVFDVKTEDDVKAAYEGIDELQKYFDKLELPRTLKEVGVKEEDVDKLADIVSRKGTRVIKHHYHDMDRDDMKEIFLSCLGQIMKRETVFELLVYLVIFAIAIVYGLTILQTHYASGESSIPSVLLYAVYIIGSVLAGVFVGAVLTELGHIIGAAVGGYTIFSVNILYFTFYKEKGKSKFKFSNFDGVTGETKIVPNLEKKPHPNPLPYLLYGTIFLAAWFAGCIVIFYTYRGNSGFDSDLAYFFLTMGVIAGVLLLYNLVPLKLETETDGHKLTRCGKKEDREAYNQFLLVQYQVENGDKQVEVEVMQEETKFTAELNMNKVYELLDKKEYEEALKLLDLVFENEKDVSKKALQQATIQKIYINIMTKSIEDAAEYYDKEVPLSLRREIANDNSLPAIRTYILMAGLLDRAKNECLIAIAKAEKAYKNTPTNRKHSELVLYNDAIDLVNKNHPKWEFEKYKLSE